MASSQQQCSSSSAPPPDEASQPRIPRLSVLCERALAIRLFHCNLRTQTLKEAEVFCAEWLKPFRVHRRLRSVLEAAVLEAVHAVQQWCEKHTELFPRTLITKRRSVSRVAYCIQDRKRFDRVALRAFRTRLAHHPLYDFWFDFLTTKDADQRMFDSDGWTPHQTVSLAFQWSLVNGFCQLTEFLWQRVTEPQREFMGLLQWRRVCFQAKYGEVVEFLCRELCELNRVGLARITWNVFYGSLARAVSEANDPDTSAASGRSSRKTKPPQSSHPGTSGNGVRCAKDIHLQRLRFLLDHCCPTLKHTLLTTNNYRGLTEVYNYNDDETFALFLRHMNPDQLQEACEFFDSMYERKPNDQLKNFRTILRRQRTIN